MSPHMRPIKGANLFPSSQRKSPEHVFATIKVFNQAGRDSIDELGENYQELSKHHRKFFKVKVKEDADDSMHYISDDSGSETDLPIPPPHNTWDGEWKITLDGMALTGSGPNFSLRMGKGSSREGADRGVDLLTTCPGKSPKGVIKVYAIFRFHKESGYLMLEGVSGRHPVRYLHDNEILLIPPQLSVVMWQTANIFYLGATMYVLAYANLSVQQTETLRQARDRVFNKAGLPAPDHRLPLFPNEPVLRRLGSTLIYKYFDSGGFGMVGVGVDRHSGKPCAVKTVHIMREDALHEMLNELEVLLKFPGKAGLIQAWYICCDHGNHFEAGQHDQVRAAFTSCGVPDHIHIIMSLAIGSFKSINWNDYTIQQIIDSQYGIILGIAVLHTAGYMDRDVTERNMLLKSGKVPVGVLSDFGKAIQTEFAKDIHIGPAYSCAPEVNGVDYYTSAIDVWSAGQAFANIIISKGYDMPDVYAFIGEVRQLTVPELNDHLDQLAGLSDSLYSPLVSIVKDMLMDKSRRPSINAVAARWSVLVSPQAHQIYNDTISSEWNETTIQPSAPSGAVAHQPLMAPPKFKRRFRQPALATNVAGINRHGDAFEGARQGRETGNIIRAGGAAFTPINRPSHLPSLQALRYIREPPMTSRVDGGAGRTPYTGYRVPILKPLPETDEDAVPAPGTGAKRTWEDRDSEDAAPERKAAKLD